MRDVGPWETKQLYEWLAVSNAENRGGEFSAEDVLSVSGEYGVVNQIEYQGRSFAGASLAHYRVLKKGQVVYTKSPLKRAPFGIIKANQFQDGIVSALYGVYDVKGAEPAFVQRYFDAIDRLNNYLCPLVNKGAKNTLLISDEDALAGTVCFPSLPEQRKIGSFFRSLDALIEARANALGKVESLKKSMLQKMFPQGESLVPEVRFREFDGEWTVKLLGEIAEFNPKCDLPDVFEYVDLESVVGTAIISHRTENRHSAPSRAQRLAKPGDVFFQTVRPYQKNNCLYSQDGKVPFVFSTGYAQLRPHVDGQFLLSALQCDVFVNRVLDECTGTSYPAINDTRLEGIAMAVPRALSEQQKIGAYFRSFDALIAARREEIGKLKQMKKALLERMFV